MVPKPKTSRLWVLYGIIGALLLALIVLAVLFGISLLSSRTTNGSVFLKNRKRQKFRIHSRGNRNEVGYSNGHLRAAFRAVHAQPQRTSISSKRVNQRFRSILVMISMNMPVERASLKWRFLAMLLDMVALIKLMNNSKVRWTVRTLYFIYNLSV